MNGRFLTFSRQRDLFEDFLSSVGLRPFQIAAENSQEKDAFLRDYLALMGALAHRNSNDLAWWTTYMASKERYTSPLPPILSCFSRCVKAMETSPASANLLVLVGVPLPLVQSLAGAAKGSCWEMVVLKHSIKGFALAGAGQLKSLMLLCKGIVSSISAVRKTKRSWDFKQRDSSRSVYLIKSFVYSRNLKDNGSFEDPFFGRLSLFLKEELGSRIDVMTVVAGFEDKQQCYRKLGQMNQDVVPIEVFISYADIVAGILEILKAIISFPFRIWGAIPFHGLDLSSTIRLLLLSGGWHLSLFHYLHYAAAKEICRRYDIRGCLFTYEGIPWERPFIEGIRKGSPKASILGYQHSVVPQSAAGVFLNRKEMEFGPIPDKILTTGKVPAEIIRKYSSFLGSDVEPACALRYEYLHDIPVAPTRRPEKINKVLVALEGVPQVVLLAEYALQQATKHRYLTFCFRPHPILPMTKVLENSKWTTELPENVALSENANVIDDVRRSDAILYWGTTVSLEAIMVGKPVIHLDVGEMLSYDPLFDLRDFKWRVTRDQEIGQTIDRIEGLSNDEYTQQMGKAQQYVKDYFFPVNRSTMRPFYHIRGKN